MSISLHRTCLLEKHVRAYVFFQLKRLTENYWFYSGETLGVPIFVFGPETHMTSIVGMALGKQKPPPPTAKRNTTANFLLPGESVSVSASE